LRKLADRITACQKLIQEASIRQHELHTKAQQVRRVADKLNRRAGRQKKSNELLPKQVAEATRQASKLEHSASQYAELQKLRLPILKSCLERLEEDSQKTEMQIIRSKTQAMTELLKSSNALMNKSRFSSSERAQAIARMEQKSSNGKQSLPKHWMLMAVSSNCHRQYLREWKKKLQRANSCLKLLWTALPCFLP
jgi:hypothetical protein